MDNQASNGRRLGGRPDQSSQPNARAEHPLVARYRSQQPNSGNAMPAALPSAPSAVSPALGPSPPPQIVPLPVPAQSVSSSVTVAVRLPQLRVPISLLLPPEPTLASLSALLVADISNALQSGGLNRQRLLDAGYTESEGALDPSRWSFVAHGQFLRQDDQVASLRTGDSLHAVLNRIPVEEQAASEQAGQHNAPPPSAGVQRGLNEAIQTMREMVQSGVDRRPFVAQMEELWDEGQLEASLRSSHPGEVVVEESEQRVLNLLADEVPTAVPPRRPGVTRVASKSPAEIFLEEIRVLSRGPPTFGGIMLLLLGMIVGPVGSLAFYAPIGCSPRLKIYLFGGILLNWLTCVLVRWMVGSVPYLSYKAHATPM